MSVCPPLLIAPLSSSRSDGSAPVYTNTASAPLDYPALRLELHLSTNQACATTHQPCASRSHAWHTGAARPIFVRSPTATSGWLNGPTDVGRLSDFETHR